MPRENLIALDVHTYRDRARESEENLLGLADIISKERRGRATHIALSDSK